MATPSRFITLVTAGMGCAVLPELAAHQASDAVKFVELADLDLEMPLELVWRKDDRSPIIDRLVKITKDCVQAV